MIKYSEHHDRKHHLRNLPDVESMESWVDSGSKDACVVIPVFSSLSVEESKANIEGYIAKSAAWALKTWRENSDAKALDIPCYIYLERDIAGVALPILYDNGISASDLIISDYDNTIWLSKCLQPVFDYRLAEYDYLIISDVDMFVVKSDDGEKLPIFSNLYNEKPSGFGCRVRNIPIPTYWMNHRKQMTENVLDIDDKESIIQEWCELMEGFTGISDFQQRIDWDISDEVPWAAIMIVQPDTFGDKVWLENACKTFCDDESSIYAWTKLSGENNMWDIDEINVNLFTDFITFYTTYHVGTPIDEPCLLHHYTSHDFRFMNIIGAVS